MSQQALERKSSIRNRRDTANPVQFGTSSGTLYNGVVARRDLQHVIRSIAKWMPVSSDMDREYSCLCERGSLARYVNKPY